TDCLRMTERQSRPREPNSEAFERHRVARRLDPQGRQILRSLYLAREARAQEIDRPLFKVVSDETLGEIAVRQPATREDLRKVPGVSPAILSRHGDLLLAAIRAGLDAGPLPFSRKPFVPPD